MYVCIITEPPVGLASWTLQEEILDFGLTLNMSMLKELGYLFSLRLRKGFNINKTKCKVF